MKNKSISFKICVKILILVFLVTASFSVFERAFAGYCDFDPLAWAGGGYLGGEDEREAAASCEGLGYPECTGRVLEGCFWDGGGGGGGDVNGVCGTANKIYSADSTSYGSDTFCESGTPNAQPGFPSQGSSVKWFCYGLGAGLDSQWCTASRLAPAPPTCSITSFTADDDTPTYGTGTTLRFSLSDSFPWSISLLAGSVLPSPDSGIDSGGVLSTGNLTEDHVYRLSCGSVFRDLPVTPAPPACVENALVEVISPLPVTMAPGQTAPFTMRVTNSGDTWWYNGDFIQFLKKSGDLSIISVAPFVGLPYGHLPDTYIPTQSVNFTFNVTAPLSPGDYSVGMQMVHYVGSYYKLPNNTNCGAPGTDTYFGNVGSVNTTVILPTHTLNVTKSGAGSGTVTSNPAGINCGSDCTENYTSGASVALTALAPAGSTFAGWSGDCFGTGTCTVAMTAARNVTATFNITAPSTDFTLHNSNAIHVTLIKGGSSKTSSNTTITVINPVNFDSSVVLFPSSGISGATYNFSDSDRTLTPSEYSQGSLFSVTVPSNTPSGIYTITIKGIGGGLERTASPDLKLSVGVYNPGWQEF